MFYYVLVCDQQANKEIVINQLIQRVYNAQQFLLLL